MTELTFTLNRTAEPADSHLTVIHKLKQYGPINGSHPFWDDILTKTLADDLTVLDLFNLPETAARQSLSDRISYAYGTLFFDGDKIDDALSQHIVRLLSSGDKDWVAFVNFLDKLQTNPSQHSRKQLYKHIDRHDFTITHDGDLVAYKGVDGKEPDFESTRSGPAIVNGVPHKSGKVPNHPGSVISMARSEVDESPSVLCAHGLHVAAWEYFAAYFSGNPKIEVHVNPRDIVSVPSDYNDSKVRVCRYVVVGAVTEPYKTPVLPDKTPQAKAADKHPTKQQFGDMAFKARAQKKGFHRFATSKGWTQIGGDGTSREDWSV
jgi:hypothetical protein